MVCVIEAHGWSTEIKHKRFRTKKEARGYSAIQLLEGHSTIVGQYKYTPYKGKIEKKYRYYRVISRNPGTAACPYHDTEEEVGHV